ncbi:MAG: hypothetical protein ACHQU0_02790 [Candidatus Paceibacteria bacterium]
MYQFTVSPSTTSTNPHLPNLLEELDQLKEQRVRLYFTYIDLDKDKGSPPVSFTFVTPSKQAHLGLGSMSWEGQRSLARLLEHEFQHDEDMSQLLLYLNNSGILVTRTEEIDGTIVFTLSPAN